MHITMTTDAYWPRINGVTVAVDSFRRSLVERGHRVSVVAPLYPPSAMDAVWPDDEWVFRFPGMAIPWSPEDRFGWPRDRRQVTRLLERLRPDVVHAHTEVTLGFSGRAYCRRHGTAHVMTRHTYWEEYMPTYSALLPRPLARLVVGAWSLLDYSRVDCVIVPSARLGTVIRGYGVRTPIETIPTGVDPREFSLDPARRRKLDAWFAARFPGLARRQVLLYAGRIVREKNIDFLLDVMERMAPRFPDSLLVLAGDGAHRGALERSARERGIGKRVLFTGYLDRTQLAWLYGCARVFVFSSKTETQGLALAEAMMCGVPAVAIAAMGTEDTLAGNAGGFLVADDPDAFAGRTAMLLADEKLRRAKAAEARRRAREWTIDATTDRLLAVYERARDAEKARRTRARGGGVSRRSPRP
jgi:glycosyltransferase involved in cell wall biosynthesis